MNILHVVPTYLPAHRYGGPIYAVHGLCRALVEIGHRVNVITTSVDGPGNSDVDHTAPVVIDGVRVHYCRSSYLRRLYYAPRMAAKCADLLPQTDVVHLHSVFLYPTWVGARSAASAHVPYVISPRGMLVEELIARRSALAKKAWIHSVGRATLSGAAHIHLTSEIERNALEMLGLALAPSAVIANGVDEPIDATGEAVSSDVYALVASGFEILSFGRINWKKGHEHLIKALPCIPDARLVIAGNDEEGIATQLRLLAERLGIGQRVTVLDRHVSGADKEALFHAARVFALCSLSENFGNAVGEAMIRGLPVVVTPEVGLAKLVAESGSGALTSTEPAEVARTVGALLSDEKLWESMGNAGRGAAEAQLSWRSVAGDMIEMYRACVDEGRVHARPDHSGVAYSQ